jgi:ornithine cyclodeaminase
VIVTATGSRRPILEGSWLRPGQHVTSVGADDSTKAELDPACFHRADVLAVGSRESAPL